MTRNESDDDLLHALGARDRANQAREDLFRPLDPDRLVAMAKGIRAQLNEEVAGEEKGEAIDTGAEGNPPWPPFEKGGIVRPPIELEGIDRGDGEPRSRRRRGRGRQQQIVALAASLMIALGLAWVMRQRAAHDVGAFATISVATSQQRSTESALSDVAALRLRPGDDVFVTAADAEGEGIPTHQLRVFLRTHGGAVHALETVHETRGPRQVAVRAVVPEGPFAAGDATLVVTAHPRRAVTVAQVRGTFRGRWEDLVHGAWRRRAVPAVLEPQNAALDVRFVGCDEVLGPPDAPRCVLSSDRTLRLWIATPVADDVMLEANGQRWTLADAETAAGDRTDGLTFNLEGLEASTLEGRTQGGATPWRLTLLDPLSAPTAKEAARERDAGSTTDARGQSAAARQAFRAGNLEQAADLLEAAAALHEVDHRRSAQIDDLTLAFYARFERLGQTQRAKAILDRLPEPLPGDLASAYLVHYYRGHWALESGDAGVALHALGQATRDAEHAGWTRQRNMAEQMVARLLGRLGRGREARAVLARLLGEIEQLPDCERVPLLNNAAWDHLQTLEAQAESPAAGVTRIVAWLEEGLAALERCPDDLGEERANLHLNLALAYLHADQRAAVRRQLDEVATHHGSLPPRFEAWQLDIAARLALAEGDATTALAASQRLAARAARGYDVEVGWRAEVGQARAFVALGDDQQAMAAYARAEHWLDEQGRRVPLDADRATSLVSRSGSTAAYLALLLDRGETRAALDVARHARVRLYRGQLLGAAPGLLAGPELAAWMATVRRYRSEQAEHRSELASASRDATVDARRLRVLEDLATTAVSPLDRRLDDLGLPASWAPPPVDPGDVLLLYHPLPAGAWVGFAATASAVRAHRFPTLDPGLAGVEMIEPFADLLATSRTIRMLPYGATAEIDVHALPIDASVVDGALIELAPVVYALDLPATAVAPIARSPTALLVAAPDGDLPAAGDEIAAVRQSLDGWRTLPLAVASPQALMTALGQCDLLHFAGHADVVGRDGLDSHMRLAGGTRLSARDVLAARVPPPDVVVLSACASARATVTSASPGLGLAQAFLLRGSRVVVGATRPVDDEVTRSLMAAFYRGWDGTAARAAEALRHAQLAVRESGSSDWSAFRVLTR